MGDRKADLVIIDEIDNYILDCCTDQARIANPTPGMDTYTKIYCLVWYILIETDHHLLTFGESTYYCESEI